MSIQCKVCVLHKNPKHFNQTFGSRNFSEMLVEFASSIFKSHNLGMQWKTFASKLFFHKNSSSYSILFPPCKFHLAETSIPITICTSSTHKNISHTRERLPHDFSTNKETNQIIELMYDRRDNRGRK